MKLEEQVCSLELAKRLKELGVKQDGVFFWRRFDSSTEREAYLSWGESPEPNNDPDADTEYDRVTIAAAFTVAELGEMLPTGIKTNQWVELDGGVLDQFHWQVWRGDDSDDEDYEFFRNKTEADARARMLIHLIEQGIVKP